MAGGRVFDHPATCSPCKANIYIGLCFACSLRKVSSLHALCMLPEPSLLVRLLAKHLLCMVEINGFLIRFTFGRNLAGIIGRPNG